MNISELQKINIKFFTTETTQVDLKELIPVFHQWIQKDFIKDHVLIDVADYTHVHNGPGLILIAHEGNFSLDQSNGKLGLLYQRKQNSLGKLQDRIQLCIQIAATACKLLENEVETGMKFDLNKFSFTANDRLIAKNTPENQNSINVLLKNISYNLFETENIVFTPNTDLRERISISVNSENEISEGYLFTNN